MKYLARRQMYDDGVTYDDGDVIKPFESWPMNTQRYLLEAGHVEAIPDAEAPRSKASPAVEEPAVVADDGDSTPKVAGKRASRGATAAGSSAKAKRGSRAK